MFFGTCWNINSYFPRVVKKKKIQRESKPPATLSKAIWLHIKEKTLLDKIPIYTWQWNC
jgi:hypothetical protein